MDELNGEIEPVSCFKCHMSLPVLIPPVFGGLNFIQTNLQNNVTSISVQPLPNTIYCIKSWSWSNFYDIESAFWLPSI